MLSPFLKWFRQNPVPTVPATPQIGLDAVIIGDKLAFGPLGT